ncbi:MAG: hypothetical protein DIU80_004350 [Chloroflexota bacterium]
MLVVAVLLAVFALPRPAAACSCPPKQSPGAALADSHAVFAGRVVRLRQPGPQVALTSTFPFFTYGVPAHAPLHVTLEVSQVWRGPSQRTTDLYTARFAAGCGFLFVLGREYLVYAVENAREQLVTYRCSRTSELGDAGEDLAFLGPGIRPAAGSPPSAVWGWALWGAGACVAAAALAGLWRRRW